MFFNWKGVAIVLSVLAAVIGLCAVDLRCSGGLETDPTVMRMKGELAAGRKAKRQLEADNLAQLARDLCALAHRYKEKGENRKAQRAMGAALELEKKIKRLLEEPRSNSGCRVPVTHSR